MAKSINTPQVQKLSEVTNSFSSMLMQFLPIIISVLCLVICYLLFKKFQSLTFISETVNKVETNVNKIIKDQELKSKETNGKFISVINHMNQMSDIINSFGNEEQIEEIEQDEEITIENNSNEQLIEINDRIEEVLPIKEEIIGELVEKQIKENIEQTKGEQIKENIEQNLQEEIRNKAQEEYDLQRQKFRLGVPSNISSNVIINNRPEISTELPKPIVSTKKQEKQNTDFRNKKVININDTYENSNNENKIVEVSESENSESESENQN